MRIVLVTHFFPPSHNAGTENYTLGLARSFIDKGHQVQVLCAGEWATGPAYWNGVVEDSHDEVPVHRVNLNWMKASDPNQALYDSPQIERWSERFFRRMEPDVIHVTSTYSLGVGLLRSARQAQIPMALTLMDFWFICPRTVLLRGDGSICGGLTTPWECQQCLLSSSGLFRGTERLLPSELQAALWNGISQKPVMSRFRGARGMALDMVDRKNVMKQALELPDVLLSHSRFVKQMFEQTNLSRRVRYLPNGHDLTWASAYQGKSNSSVLRIGYMGQISETKGVHILIKAFRNIEHKGSARLDIWGDPGKDAEYTRRLQDLIGDSQAMTLRGRFEREHLARVLAEIDVLVVPSLWYENAPLVIHEAFATATPVVATNLGGMAEAVTHEVDGLLFERGDIDDLRQQLQRVLDDPQLLRDLQNRVPAVKTMDEEVGELQAIYEDLIAGK